MVDLQARAALEVRPAEIGGARLAVLEPGVMTAVLAPARGGGIEGLAGFGLGFPAPGEAALGREGARILWIGAGQALLVGAPAAGLSGAALVDQSDSWVALELSGPDAPEVLARLCPLDAGAMRPGDTARSLLGHMPLSLTCWEEGFWVLTFRSMARDAWEEITGAMRAVAARDTVPGARG